MHLPRDKIIQEGHPLERTIVKSKKSKATRKSKRYVEKYRDIVEKSDEDSNYDEFGLSSFKDRGHNKRL